METIILGAALAKRAVIGETLANMEPIVNIHEEEGIVVYRAIIILKMVFVNYAMMFTIPKPMTMAILLIGNCLITFTQPEHASFSYVTLPTILIFIFRGTGRRFEIPTLLFCALAMNSKPFEFIIDMYLLLCLAWSACQAYSREVQKMATGIILMLSLGWYVGNTKEPLTLAYACYIMTFLVFIYFPLMPNRATPYRNRLIYFYALMFLWMLYKIHQNSYCENLTISSGGENSCPAKIASFDISTNEKFNEDEETFEEFAWRRRLKNSHKLISKAAAAPSLQINATLDEFKEFFFKYNGMYKLFAASDYYEANVSYEELEYMEKEYEELEYMEKEYKD